MRLLQEIDAGTLSKTQLEQVKEWHRIEPTPDPAPSTLEGWLQRLHLMNYRLWHLEDLARDPKSTDAAIAQVKRSIDVTNQQRNDSIEQIDERVLGMLTTEKKNQGASATLHSETFGALTDRLSINALKRFHMEEQLHRTDVTSDHLVKCQRRVEILDEQRHDLTGCLRTLVNGLEKGLITFKIYRQFKMYNDTTLNPVFYSGKKNKKG
jgi:hypothetical protein